MGTRVTGSTKGRAESPNTGSQSQQCPQDSGNLSSHCNWSKRASAGAGHGVGSLHAVPHSTLSTAPSGNTVIVPAKTDETARGFASCPRSLSGRGGILTWVRLISSDLFPLLAIHRLHGNSNYMCPTLLVELLGDSGEMRRCFVNSGRLFLGRLAPSVVF